MSKKHLAIESSAMTTAHEDCSAKEFLSGATDLSSHTIPESWKQDEKHNDNSSEHNHKK